MSRVQLCDRCQPTRLPHSWDSRGKNTGAGCHFLLQCMKVKSESEVAQSCPTLRDPMDCSLPSSSVHGIFQARVLEWGAIAFSLSDSRYTKILLFKFQASIFHPNWKSKTGNSLTNVTRTKSKTWEIWKNQLFN